MTTTTTHPTVVLERQVSNHQLPGWLRVAFWCWTHTDHHGHARAYPGQLRTELGFTTSREVSRSIRLARERHLIDDCSTAGCVVTPGNADAPCVAHHRDDR